MSPFGCTPNNLLPCVDRGGLQHNAEHKLRDGGKTIVVEPVGLIIDAVVVAMESGEGEDDQDTGLLKRDVVAPTAAVGQ